MSRFPPAIAISFLSAARVFPMPGEAQRRPNLSGHWTLVEALASGPGRDSTDRAATARPTMSTTISGAPFNCGRECTITHRGQTLTIANAQLAEYPGKDKSQPTPAVTLHLDGRQTEVVDSFSPSRQLPVVARWEGNAVRIESRTQESSVVWIQVLRLEGAQLVVVSSTTINGEARAQTTFTYRRK
jgi:hypothetical protein